jgi:hypothetical protein
LLVKDNSLNDSLYNQILNDSSFFPELMNHGEKIAEHLNSYHNEKSDCFAPYMFWDGWWRTPANTLKKKVIQSLWEDLMIWNLDDILGFEYWTRTYLPGQYLDVHVDEDTFLYSESKIFTGPIYGCVFYGKENKDGGFLEIHKKALEDGKKNILEKKYIKKYISLKKDREKISYKGNRAIFFDAGHVLHNTVGSKSGIRQVLVINIWHKDNPPLALSNGSFFYE